MSQPISRYPPVNRKGEREEEVEKKFPLLDLPNELISHIFSFVRHEDRISLRVNERLDEIELNGRYYNESIIVGLNSVQFIDYNGNSLELAIEGEEGKRAIEELKRVAKNTTYDEVECKDEEDVNPDVTARVEEMFSILCNIKAREFRLMANQIKDDSSLLATLKYKNEVTIKYIITGITAEGLLSLYQKIRNGEVDAKFVILCVSEEVWEGFLDLAKEEKFQLLWTTKGIFPDGRLVTISLYDDEDKWEGREEKLFGEDSLYVVDQIDVVELKDHDR